MAALWRVMRRILKWGGIAVLGVLALVLVLFTVAWVINAHDEPLGQQAKSLLIPPPNPYSPEDNIYLALAGFDAPPGGSVTAEGQARVEEYNARLAVAERDAHWQAMYTSLTKERPGSLQFKGNSDFLQPTSKTYWNDVPPHRAEIAKLLAGNSELVQRYRELHRRHAYHETARPSPLAPMYLAHIEARRLFLADVVLRLLAADARERQQALTDLHDDVQLWRVVFTGEGTPVSKLIAINYIHSDELLLAEVIADPQPLPAATDDADAIAPVFAPEDWNIGAVFFSDFRVHVQMLQQMYFLTHAGVTPARDCESEVRSWLCHVSDKLGDHFFKLNASENLYAAQALRLARESVLGNMQRGFVDTDEGLVSLRSVYNPFGRMLVALGAPVYRQYAWRAWDGAAFQRLVRLGYEIRRQRIDTQAIPAFLKEHPQWSTHPGDGRPFLWDPAKEQISVQTMVKQTGQRLFSIHVWKAPSGA